MIDYKDANDNDLSHLFYEDSVYKNWILSFYHIEEGEPVIDEVLNNQNISLESIQVSESICSQSSLMFGGCESNQFKCTIVGIRTSHLNKTFTVDIILDGDVDNPFRVGTYIVKSDKPTADRSGREITAYDMLYDVLNADVAEWWNTLPWSGNECSVKTIRDSFCNYYGIPQENTALVNDSIKIKQSTKDSLSGKQFLTNLCEINACFGTVGRDNVFHYKILTEIITGLYPNQPLQEIGTTGVFSLFPEDTLYPKEEEVGAVVTKGHYLNAKYEDYIVNRISKVAVWDEEGNKLATSGTGDNIYNIANNMLASAITGTGQSTAQNLADNFYAKAHIIWYMISDAKAIGNPCLEVGDSIRLVTKYDIVYLFIMERTLSGVHALKDTYRSNGEEFRTDDMSSRKHYGSYYKDINRDIGYNVSSIKLLNTGLGTLNTNLDNLSINVSTNYLTKTSASSTYLAKTDASSTYLTKTDASNTYQTKPAAGQTFATQGWVNQQGYATQGWVGNQGYLTSVPAGYATESWVSRQGYITSSALSGYYNSVSDVNTAFAYSAMTPQRVETTGNISCGGNLSVSGNLSVNGTINGFTTITIYAGGHQYNAIGKQIQ